MLPDMDCKKHDIHSAFPYIKDLSTTFAVFDDMQRYRGDELYWMSTILWLSNKLNMNIMNM